MGRLKLHIAEKADFSSSVIQILRSHFEIVEFDNESTIKDILEQVDIFWFRLGYKINGDVLKENSRCKYLVTPVTGIDHIDENLCHKFGVKIICLRGEYDFLNKIRATAELTLALTLALLRRLTDAIIHTQNGNWQRDQFRGRELFGKKVGIIGYGRLGKICGDYFLAMGCEVGYFDIMDKLHPDSIIRYNSLSQLLAESDVISIHIPYNESTIKLIDASCFQKMKRNAILINTSRGGVIDEGALLHALQNKIISGAALDVLQGEPNVEHNELIIYSRSGENLIITPHIGGNTYESFEKTEHFMAEKLIAAAFKEISH